MDIALLIKAAILGIVEGLTEFLPISSTGHLILASSLLDFRGENVATFEIAIQTGAMFAVIWEYRQKLFGTLAGILRERTAQRFAVNVIVAFFPAVVFGLTLGSFIKDKLFHPVPVAIAFVVGGLIILWAEARPRRPFGERDLEGRRHARVETVDDMSMLDALKVGLVQCLALIRGSVILPMMGAIPVPMKKQDVYRNAWYKVHVGRRDKHYGRWPEITNGGRGVPIPMFMLIWAKLPSEYPINTARMAPISRILFDSFFIRDSPFIFVSSTLIRLFIARTFYAASTFPQYKAFHNSDAYKRLPSSQG